MTNFEQGSEQEVTKATFSSEFPLYPEIDFDSWLGGELYPVGIHSHYPEDLLDRLAAGVISYVLQTQPNTEYKKIKGNVDRSLEIYGINLKINEFIHRSIKDIGKFFQVERPDFISENHAGLVIGDSFLFRCVSSFYAALTLANRGYLQEPISVIRSSTETISWAYQISNEPDPNKIHKLKSRRSIGKSKEIFPHVGEFYGYLSNMSHLEFESQINFFDISDGRLGIMMRSSTFKCYSLVCLLILISYHTIVCKYYYEKMFENNKIDKFPSYFDESISFSNSLLKSIFHMFPEDYKLLRFAKIACDFSE